MSIEGAESVPSSENRFYLKLFLLGFPELTKVPNRGIDRMRETLDR